MKTHDANILHTCRSQTFQTIWWTRHIYKSCCRITTEMSPRMSQTDRLALDITIRNSVRIQDFIHVKMTSYSSNLVRGAARLWLLLSPPVVAPWARSQPPRVPASPSSCWTRILRCPWARSPRRSRPGAAATTPGGLVPTLEVEHDD